MGLRAITPGPHTSKRCKDHAVYPYLLRDLEVLKPNQVWATDITYVPLPGGFMYLTAVIDLYSRYVLHWSISNTMEACWCKEMIADAIKMDGKGRATDNAFIERLWRTVKYENIRFKEYRNGLDLYTGLKEYFTEYNEIRRHTSLEDQRPKEVFEHLLRPINEYLQIQR
jgi:putative transposase